MDLKTRRRINAEQKRLFEIFGSDAPKMKAAKGLIENAAYMKVSLEDLREEIAENGCVEEYQNGANQSGMKKSAAFDCYSTTYKNYLATIKQLTDIAPEGTGGDALDDFLK